MGPYRLQERLGEGGMGVVYRAVDTRLNRPVAIKVLFEDVAGGSARHRFQREAQLASSLNHPHILTVYETGDLDGRQYLVTEFVDGGTLRGWVKGETRDRRQILELLAGVADGLAAAHDAGILHRDVKPDNVLVAKSGHAKLADFGLAKTDQNAMTAPITAIADYTRPGVVLGTVAYMNLWALSTATGKWRRLTDFATRNVVIARRIAWSRDSKYLYTSMSDVDSDVVMLASLGR